MADATITKTPAEAAAPFNTAVTQLGEEAGYQIEAIIQALRTAAREADDTLPNLVRSMVARLDDLNGVMLSVIRRDSDDVADLRNIVHGTGVA